MVSIDETPLTPDDVKVKQRSGLYPVKVPYSWFPTVRLVEKRSFFPRCLRFQGFLNLKVYCACFASFRFSSCDRWEKHEGTTNSGNFWQHQIAQYVSLVSAVPATPSAAGFGRSLGGQQDPEESHSCSTLGGTWVGWFATGPGLVVLMGSTGCQALRAVEEMKRGRGDDFRFISTEDKKEAKGCWGLISRLGGRHDGWWW